MRGHAFNIVNDPRRVMYAKQEHELTRSRIEIRQSTINPEMRGAFAAVDIPAFTFLGTYWGDVVDADKYASSLSIDEMYYAFTLFRWVIAARSKFNSGWNGRPRARVALWRSLVANESAQHASAGPATNSPRWTCLRPIRTRKPSPGRWWCQDTPRRQAIPCLSSTRLPQAWSSTSCLVRCANAPSFPGVGLYACPLRCESVLPRTPRGRSGILGLRDEL